MLRLAKHAIPKPLRARLRKPLYPLIVLSQLKGLYPRECNICGYKGLFAYVGDPPRRDARCKSCDSEERHRLMKLWLDRNLAELSQLEVLHFAPEPAIRKVVSPFVRRYLSADIMPGRADLVLNIEAIESPDSSFDWIICSHVLEHIDDTKALPELYRVLKPGGILLIMVPIAEGWDSTYENPTVTSDAGRDLLFGQHNHVRYYGRDLRDRIKAVGFELTEMTAEEPEVSRFSLLRGEKVFIARRPASLPA